MTVSPHNTAKDDPALHLLDAMDAQRRTGNPSDMILEQGAAGQNELVNSEVLPTQINGFPDADLIKGGLGSKFGFKFGDVVDGDELFQHVELPACWKKEATDHSMWSKVVDDKGRERLSIFYKAAFYDRDAFFNIIPAIRVNVEEEDVNDGKRITVHVEKCGERIFSTNPVVAVGDVHSVYNCRDIEREKALKWLEEHYPDHKNPIAYWD